MQSRPSQTPFGRVALAAAAVCAALLLAATAPSASASPALTVLYSFAVGSGGADPTARGLTLDGAGNLYGTTLFGGPSNQGVAFKLAPDGAYTVLHAFTGGSDGGGPTGGLAPYALA